MWQYSSTGSVGGIAGNVDLDRFDGTLADLQLLAGGSYSWAASYVSQSWPLAAMSLDLTVNETRVHNELYQLLTTDQRAQLKEIEAKHEARMQKHMQEAPPAPPSE